jgi:hypothetical protein
MSPITTDTLLSEMTLGPLTAEQRSAIMSEAVVLNTEARKLFRRLLVLAQERGLSGESIARAAAQAREHVAGVQNA